MANIKSGLVTKKKKKRSKTPDYSLKSAQQLEEPESIYVFDISYVNTTCVLNTRCPAKECIEQCQLKNNGWVDD